MERELFLTVFLHIIALPIIAHLHIALTFFLFLHPSFTEEMIGF
jgi:hypothetical protein